MRPLSALAPHARGLRGIFTDIDDTLTHAGVLVPEAYGLLSAAKAAGLRVVPVTGRPAGWAAVLAATWPVDAVVGENGAVGFRRWHAQGRSFVGSNFWDSEEVRAAARPFLDAIRTEVLREVPRARMADDQWLRLCDLAFDIGETQTLAPDEVQQICHLIEAGGARAAVSTVHAHALMSDYDKARMCVRMAREIWDEDLDAHKDRYIFVGDSPNDQTGFAYFPLSIGVANVARYAAELHPPPAFITEAPGGHGFAEAVGLILANR